MGCVCGVRVCVWGGVCGMCVCVCGVRVCVCVWGGCVCGMCACRVRERVCVQYRVHFYKAMEMKIPKPLHGAFVFSYKIIKYAAQKM